MAQRGDYEWQGCLEPVTNATINHVERRLGVRLPESFRDCVRRCHGGVPGTVSFSYQEPDGLRLSDSLGNFFTFRDPLDRETKLRLAWEPLAWRELGIERS